MRSNRFVEIVIALEIIRCHMPAFRDGCDHRTLDVRLTEEYNVLAQRSLTKMLTDTRFRYRRQDCHPWPAR